MRYTVLAGGGSEVLDAEPEPAPPGPADERRLLAPLDAPVLGWERRPHGWCRGDACIPAAAVAGIEHDGRIDVGAFAELQGSLAVADHENGLLAVMPLPDTRPRGGAAPDFALRGPDGALHRLSDYRGRKVALVMWASWCGCRYDLPAWEERHRELSPHGLTVISVALDRAVEDARPWIDEAVPAHPALVDTEGEVAALYDVVNVPTAVWIDERGRVARPQDSQVATDLFQSMNGLSAEASLRALRRWVREGDTGLPAGGAAPGFRAPTAEGQRARAHARIAVELHRRGDAAAAENHYRRAAELAPHDVTVRRGLMGLRGEDPFGDAYFALREELGAAGIPVYRPLPTDASAEAEV
ncbi:redoxin domain-containing protein [Streptomonospora sp. PA3]|uniref:redoxin domain-containing protein n=1 Tax=Streptomonospora sp. PA3 TaxID=2607326 RepID=UPI0012DE6A4F|nr:redoxin domain-containing protein [Streptomonospora sp. PA3]MUL42683.1 redoxin domain-containing protein [Streptomonospora sp. PA3]